MAGAAARAVVGTLSAFAPGLGIDDVDERAIGRDAAARNAMAADAALSREKLPARTIATILGGILDVQPRLGQISVPIMVLHGDADRVTDPAGSADLVRLAASRDKTLRTFPAALHDLPHEPEGPQVEREIVAFAVSRAR